MKHTVKYVNGKGDVIDFTAGLMNADGSINPYHLVSGTFMDYELDYNSSDDYRLRGSKITAFKRSATDFTLELDVLAATETVYISAINALHDIVDYDVDAQVPGTLYVDGSYIKCYIRASSKEDWESPVLFLSVTLTAVAEFPAWWTEKAYSFAAIEATEEAEEDDFVVAVGDSEEADFPYEFLNGTTTRIINNASAYKTSYYILRIYGPCTNPTVTIGSLTVEVNVTLGVNDVLEINSYERTITVTNTKSGVVTNAFGSRSREVDIFTRIDTGYVSVYTSSDFAFDLVLLDKRSEPLWTS